MPPSLLARIAAIARLAQRRQVLIACLAAAAAGLAGLLVLGVGDWLLRPVLWPGRLIFSLLALTVLAAAAKKFLWPLRALGERFNLVQTARKVEESFPQLREHLSAAIAFLQEPAHDSPALRRSVVAATEALAADCRLETALDPRPLRRAGAAFAGVLLAALTLTALHPAAAVTALARLAAPWGGPAWPPRHRLQWVQAPRAIPYGGDLELAVIDHNGRLPETVEVWLRLPSGEVRRQPMKRLREQMVFHLAQLTAPLEYRVQGGDDLLQPWISLAVVQPPKLVDVGLTIEPPAYLQAPPERLGPVARVVRGASVVVQGVVDRPLRGLRLLPLNAKDAAAPAAALPSPALPNALVGEVAPDGLSFRFPPFSAPHWRPAETGAWKIELTSEGGELQVQEGAVELTVFTDQPPALAWESPLDQAVATPVALVPVRALAKDDLALSAVELRYAVVGSEASTEQTLVLWRRPEPAAVTSRGALANRTSAAQVQQIDLAWDLATLNPPLEAGQSLAVRLVARDAQPQESDAGVRRLLIVPPETLEQRLAQQQAAVLDRLVEALRLQRVAREQTAELARRLAETAAPTPAELDLLHSAELQQRQVEQLLSDHDGVGRDLAALLEQLAANRLDTQPMAQRLRELAAQAQALRTGPLAGLSEQLAALAKALRERLVPSDNPPDNPACQESPPPAAPPRGGQPLAAIAAQQDRALAALEAMLGDLAQWDSFSRVGRELGQLRLQQEALAAQTEQLRLELAAAGTSEAQAAAQSAARSQAGRQLELARELDKVLGRSGALGEKLQTADPNLAGRLALMLEAASRLAPAGAMRTAAQELQAARLSEALPHQREASAGLTQLVDLLQDKAAHDPRQRAAALQAGLVDLNRLFAQLRAQAAEAGAATQEPARPEQARRLARLAPELAQTAAEVQALARKLQRLRALPAAQATAAAQKSAATAAQAAQAGAAQTAEQAEQALAQLQEARTQLARAVQQAEEDLVREQLARLDTAIAGLAARQRSLLTETQRLDQVRQKQSELTPAQSQTLSELAAEEEQLLAELARLRKELTQLAAFELVLAGIEREMTAAATELRRGVSSAAAQAPQERALARIALLQQAVQASDQTPAPEENPQQPPPEGQPPDAGQTPQVRGLAELELALLLQQDLNRRTQALAAEQARSGALSPEQAAELQQLSAEQAALARLVLDLVPPQGQPAPAPDARDPEPPPGPPAPPNPPAGKKPTGNPLDDELLRDLLPKGAPR